MVERPPPKRKVVGSSPMVVGSFLLQFTLPLVLLLSPLERERGNLAWAILCEFINPFFCFCFSFFFPFTACVCVLLLLLMETALYARIRLVLLRTLQFPLPCHTHTHTLLYLGRTVTVRLMPG